MDLYEYNEKTYELFCKAPKKYQPYPGGLGKMYFDRINQLIKEEEDLVAQIDSSTGKKQTFKELLKSSKKLGQFIRANGIKPGENITMCSYNHINSEVVMLACHFTGAVISCTDPILSLKDTKYLLDMIKPKLIFVSDGSEDIMQTSVDALQLETQIISVTLDSHPKYKTINQILEEINEPENFEPYFAQDLDEVYSILFSSGTTGMPKGICLSHNYMMLGLIGVPNMILKWVIFNYATFYWISCVIGLGFSIKMGSARLLARKFDKSIHWTNTAKYKVTYLLLSNTYFIEASKNIPDNAEIPDLKTLIIGGGRVPEKNFNEYVEKLPNVQVCYLYALTEGGLVAQFKPGDKSGTNGKPEFFNQTVKIVDPETNKNLPLNKIGEIRIKRAHQMVGYYKMDSKDAWDEQGFLKTGDLGYLDDEFHLHIVDRIKEMFKYRSWHIVPAKIEHVLGSHPDVLYAVVVGKPTFDADENHAMAIVSLRDGATTSAKELEKFTNEKMDDLNQIRAGVKIIPKSEIPFTPTGKIIKRALKAKFI